MLKSGSFKWRIIVNKILFYIVISLVLGNIALSARVGALFVNLRQLNEKEQSQLEAVFPLLSEEKIKNSLKKFYPELTSYHQETRGSLIRYEVYHRSTLLGTAYQIREDIYCPVCIDVRAFVKIKDGKIGDIDLINPFHLYVKPMPVELQEAFLLQFLNQKIKTNMKVGFTIDGISGATKTAKSFVHGINKIKFDKERDSK